MRFSREDKDKRFKNIFLWDMAFATGERKELRITYTMPFSIGLAATSKDREKRISNTKRWYHYFEDSISEGFGYVTETGKSWSGKIEQARFRINLRAMETFLKQRGLPEGLLPSAASEERLEKEEQERDARMQQSDEEAPGWSEEFKQAMKKTKEETRIRMEQLRKAQKEERIASFPIAKPPFFREVTPTGWTEAADGSIVWDVKDYMPGNPITVFYNFICCIPQTRDDTKQLITKTFKNKLTDDDAQDLEDILRAFYGVKVNNPRIADFLENQKWYPAGGQKPLPAGIIETIEKLKEKK